MAVWVNGMFRKLYQDRDVLDATNSARPTWEYCSRAELLGLLGLPVVHFRFNNSSTQRSSVKAGIAVG